MTCLRNGTLHQELERTESRFATTAPTVMLATLFACSTALLLPSARPAPQRRFDAIRMTEVQRELPAGWSEIALLHQTPTQFLYLLPLTCANVCCQCMDSRDWLQRR